MANQNDIDILVTDSVTKLDRRHRGAVLISGSHGGLYAGYCAAKAGVRGVILNDASVGKEDAGIASLGYFDGLGAPAAVVSHDTALIGDGGHMVAHGIISYVNRTAAALGCAVGQTAAAAARLMAAARQFDAVPPAYEESRFPLRQEAGEREVWGLDSASLVRPEDAGRILIVASHGGLLAGNAASALQVEAHAAIFNDAGVGIDRAGIGRLPALADRGIAAATVAASSARIGDSRSSWESGMISHVNRIAAGLGVAAGMTTKQAVDGLLHEAA